MFVVHKILYYTIMHMQHTQRDRVRCAIVHCCAHTAKTANTIVRTDVNTSAHMHLHNMSAFSNYSGTGLMQLAENAKKAL